MCITMLSLVMSITMLSSVSAKEASIEYQGVWTDYAAKEYAAGDGTKESPYLIKDASELALLAINIINQFLILIYLDIFGIQLGM